MATKPQKIGIPIVKSGIVPTNESPDDYVWDQWVKPEAPNTAPAADAPGQMRSGFNRAFAEVPAMAAGSAAYIADVVGANDTRDSLLGYAKKSSEATAETHKNDAGSITDAWDGKTSWSDFLKNATGYVAGQALQGIATGGIGALGARMLATQGVKAVVEQAAARAIAGGAAQEAATAIAADAGKAYMTKMVTRGAVAGAGTQNLNMELGSIYPDAVDEATKQGRTLDAGDKFRIGASALAAAGVDTAAEAITANRVFRGSKVGAGMEKPPALMGSEMLSRAVREIPSGMVREAGTEGVQTAIEHYGAGQPIADDKGIRDIVDSMGVGAVGGILGGAGASLNAKHVPEAGPLSRGANAGIDAAGPVIVPPAPPPLTPEQTQSLLDHANERARVLEEKANGTKDQKIKAPDGTPVTIPGQPKQFLTPDDKEEQAFLTEHGGDAQALAAVYPGLVAAPKVELVPLATPASETEPVIDAPWPDRAEVLPKPSIEARIQRESDRPAAPVGKVMDGDILNRTTGQPFKTMPGAMKALAIAGDTHEIVRVAAGFVVRAKESNGATTETAGLAQPADAGLGNQPVGSGNNALDTASAVADEQGAVPSAPGGSVAPGQTVVGASNGANAVGTIDEHAHAAATSPKNDLPQPTDGQKDAGNYKKGHVTLNGLDLSIENPAGSQRSGVSPDRKAWTNTLNHHYGYIKGTVGNDKDHFDLFVKPETPLDYSGSVYVVDQIHPHTGKFDEHKALVGFSSEQEAKDAYHSNYDKNWKGMQAITAMPFNDFKSWVKDGAKNKPLAKTAPATPSSGISSTPTASVVTPEPATNEVWTRMPHAERLALTTKTGMAKLVADKIARTAWADITPKTRERIKAAQTIAPVEGLTHTTPEQVKADEDRAAKAEKAAKAAKAQRAAQDLIDKMEQERKDIAKASEGAAATFTLGGDATQNLTGQQDVFGAPEAPAEPAATSDKDKAQADLMNALSDLGDIFNKPFKANITPEQEQKLLPVLTRVLDAAFRLGYVKFKDAAKFALDSIRKALGSDTADALTLDHLQGAYIAMAGGKQGTDTKRDVIDIEDKSEIEGHTASNSTTEAPAPAPSKAEKVDIVDEVDESNLDEPEGRDGWKSIGYIEGINGYNYRVDLRNIRKSDNGVIKAIRQIRIYDDNHASHMAAWEWRSAKFGSDILEGLQVDHAIFHYVNSGETDSAFGKDATDGDALWARYGDQIVSSVRAESQQENKPEPADTEKPLGLPAPANAPKLVTYVTAKGKTLQGVIRTDLTYAQAKAIDRFTFKKDGGYFIREKHLDELNAAHPQTSTTSAGVTLDTTEGRHAIAQMVADELIGGKEFATIIEARKFIAEKTGSEQAQPGTEQAKRADEAIELGVVLASREIVQAARKQGRSDETIFNRLVGIYKAQPALNVRDSVSLRNQAYSTPVPLAFVASRLSLVTPEKKVGEPTAGNGALLMEADPKNTTTNEIQPDRLEALRSQGFTPTSKDAAAMEFAPKSLDSLVMNPPFGPVNGQRWTFGDFNTGEIDHAIVLNALKALKDDGSAVMIIGGTLAEDDNARKVAYRGKAKREFFYTLYNEYNVVDHFTVSGDLYKKQGAAFPVDVLVIRGRGKSERGLPAAQLPTILKTWDEVKGKLNESNNDSGVVAGTSGSVGSNLNSNEPNTQPANISGTTVSPNRPDGRGNGSDGPATSSRPPDRSGATVSAPGPGSVNGAPTGAGQRGNAGTSSQPGNTGTNAVTSNSNKQEGRGNNESDKPTGVDAGSRPGFDKQGLTDAANSGRLQVKYQNFSANKSVNTLVATNHLSAIENAFNNLRARVGDIDEFVRAELQYEPEQFKKSFSAEQVEALALSIDNIDQNKGFIIGDQTGIGKGRVVAAMIRYAKLNGKMPVFVTQMPDLYGDMMRDLNDIGMTSTRPLMTNNNASVPLDAEALKWFGEKQEITSRMTELQDEIDAISLEEIGEKALAGLSTTEREDLIAKTGKLSKNPEVISLRDEIKELKGTIPKRRGLFLDTPNIEKHERDLQAMVSRGDIGNHDVIFTTYNQMAALDSGKPRKDKVTGQKIQARAPVFGYRTTFLNHFINDNSMLILDESHNAGEAGDGRFPKVGDEVRRHIDRSGGVFYSSATFAKNTAVMDIYRKTDLGSAFASAQELMDAINSVPMQQITSAMLVEAGQYLRRERSFDGIDYKTETVEVDRQAAEDVATAMRLVVAFDKAKKEAIANIQEQLDAEGAVMAAVNGGGSSASVDSVNFTSVMHNVVNTFLLALKADSAAKSAIAAIRAGEKPVLTVANTMEMFITEYARESGLGIGDKLNATFADVLKRYLEKTRKATIKEPNGDSRVIVLTDTQLGFDGMSAYNEAFDFIDGMELDIPLSPIDHIKQRIEEAGYSIGEITGRQTVVVNGVLRSRNKAELNTAGKKSTIAKFNGGPLDALIINRSGSTGLSMHSSETFADQRRRVMIVAQAELDINNHMQMLGRVNRTGQVTENGTSPNDGPALYGLPRYAQMTANVPIELRPAAVLSNKMAGLNANTTAGRKGAVQDQSALDFMNKYGDRVAAAMVGGNAMLNASLGHPVHMDEHGEPTVQGAMARVTGRIGLLPLAQQNDLYGQLATEYAELISQLDALGQNDLEAKTYPLDAETIETKVVQKADAGAASPFTSAIVAEKVSMKKLGKPFPTAKVQEMVDASLKGRTSSTIRQEMVGMVREQINAEINTLHGSKAAATASERISIEKHIGLLETARTRFAQSIPYLGANVVLKTEAGNLYGVVTNIDKTGKAKSASALSAWKIRIAVVDGARSMTLPLTQIYTEDGNVPPNGIVMQPATEMSIPNADRTGFDTLPIMEAFDRGQSESRETRVVITGNILRGYGALRGRLLNYTDNKGGIRQGILMPADFDMNAVQARFTPSLKNADEAVSLLDRGGIVIDKGNAGETLRIQKAGGAYTISVSKTGQGKRLARNGGELNFVSSGNKMKVRVWDADLVKDFLKNVVKPEGIAIIPSADSVRLMQDENGTAFSRSTGPDTGLTTLEVNSIVNAIKERWGNAPEVVVAESMEDAAIPQTVRDYDQKQRSLGATGAPEGFVHGGKVYLMSDQLNDPASVMRVLFHESLGHLGLRGVFGERLTPILKQLASLRSADVKAKAEQYGLDMSIESDRLIAAEEVLAELAQTKPELGYVQRSIASIRSWLRANVPGFGGMKLSDADIIGQFILPARRFIEGGNGPKGGSKAPILGTSSKIPAFSRSLGESLTAGINNVRDVKLAAGYQVGDLFKGEGRLHWWHKSVGSMFHLAEKSPPFKRVYDSIQNFLNDVSYYAAEAADVAPNILPKLDKIGDVFKSPLSAADTKALSAPVFEGTLAWGRDKDGVARPMDQIEAELSKTTLDDKAHMLVRGGHLDPKVLRMWQGLEQDKYEAIINGKFEKTFMKPGVVFTPAELAKHFNMTPAQVKLYQEFRTATDKSIDHLAISEMLNYAGKDADPVRDQIIGMSDVDEAAQTLRDYLVSLTDLMPERDGVLSATAAKMLDIAAHAQDMKDKGYAPLSRFGTYTLEATLPTGERYFSLFETDRERNKMKRLLASEGATGIVPGTMSQEAYKMLNGVSPETAALFGEMLGLDSQGSEAKDIAYQEYIKLGTSNRSAMKRLLHRKGVAGYSEDAGRVLAGFIYSNARKTSSNLHGKETIAAVADIPKEQGELKDAAVKLQEYVSNPQEEMQAFRGILFAQYLGGSVASALVNSTQPFTVTLPYLSQYGGIRKAGSQMVAAVRDATKEKTGDARLDAALKFAEEEGIVSPQEVHQLQAQAMGRASLKSGDGTLAGDALAKGSNALSKLSMAWGKVFGVAEQFNRRVTFIAAYRTAIEQGIANPAEFAAKTVAATQFTYNKGNKPRWGRGAVGSVLFTFKQYSVNYLELVTRMATAGEPGSAERKAGQKAALLAIAILFMLSGSEGLPFAEDIDDVIDGAMQRLGYNFNSKARMKSFLVNQLGKDGAEFVSSGISGLPGAPIDVSGRLGMANLIPGTGLFLKKTDHTRDLMELAGPAGDFAKRAFNAGEQALYGDIGGAINKVSPLASRNVVKALDMADTGMYRDDKGRKVVDTTLPEAFMKGIGFQPRNVKDVQDASMTVQRAKDQYNIAASEIRQTMANAIFSNDATMKQSARDALAAWNVNNPDQHMSLNMPAVLTKVREMRKSKEQRMADTAPKAIRAQVREQLREQLH